MSGLPTNYSFSLKSETLGLCQLQWGDKANDLRWKNRLSAIKSHFLLPSVVICHLKAQSQPAIIHSHSLTPPDFLWTHGAVFLPCLQKPSLFVWSRKLEIHLLNKGLHGFCALTVNTVWWQVKAKAESMKNQKEIGAEFGGRGAGEWFLHML